MPNFKYKIKNNSGDILELTAVANDRYMLAKDLKSAGNNVISIEEESENVGFFDMEHINTILSRIKLSDKIYFTKNLSVMIKAGLSLSRALGILARQMKNPKFKKVIEALSEDLDKGTTLSDSMAKFPKVFSPLFISMTRAGEESGKLSSTLNMIGQQLEKSYALRKKIKGAMIYPAIVISAMIVIAILMLIYVVPTLTATFEDLGGELPRSTELIIFTSNILSEHTLLFLLSIVSLISLFLYVKSLDIGKRAIDFLVLRLPIISKITKQSNSAQTARTLSSLLSSGVDMIEALSITKDVTQNSYFKEVLKKAGEDIQKGLPLSTVFGGAHKTYPLLVGEMIKVGEETGKLSDMLIEISIFYENEVDSVTKNLATVIEPVLMLVVGVGVGFFAISMISPMYEVMNNIQ